jgi:putative ABC transport system ATP-binding protein
MQRNKSVAIGLKQVDKIYQTGKLMVPALLDATLTIEKGEMVAITGPSGSGKSTLMNILGLLDRPSNGQVTINDHLIDLSMSDRKLSILRGLTIGFVFQSFNLLPRLSALDNVILPATYQKKKLTLSMKERAIDLLKQVGLGERLHHKPNELSGGEKQRVAIARALMNDPEVILADEPTGNLDSKSGKEIISLLQELQKKGKTVVIITHDPKIAASCQRTIEVLDGHIVGGSRA